MADILEFPARTARSRPPYQLHRFAPGGDVLATLLIHARTDALARRRARGLDDGVRAELWSGARFVSHFGRADHPVAASIRPLGGPTRPTDAPGIRLVRAPEPPE